MLRVARTSSRPSASAPLAGLLALMLLVVGARWSPAQDETDELDPSEARPPAGLLIVLADNALHGALHGRSESPTLRLTAGQAPDPRLPAGSWHVKWRGRLESIADAPYQFSAELLGQLTLRIDGREALSAIHEQLGTVTSEPVTLSFGWHEVEIELRPAPRGAALRLLWECELFAREPIPATAWAPPADVVAADAEGRDALVEGQLTVEEHNCAACHQTAEENSPKLTRRPGPKLEAASPRWNRAWTERWLENPSAWRPEAVMPRLFADDAHGAVERWAVAQLLAGRDMAAPAASAANQHTSGEQLYWQVGCAACHEPQGTQPSQATLARLAEKYDREHLAEYLQRPGDFDPAGRMPSLGLTADEAASLADWLLTRDRFAEPIAASAVPDSAAIAAAFAALRPSSETQNRFAAAPAREQQDMLARAALAARRCQACHELGDELRDANWLVPSSAPALADLTAAAGGCLQTADKPTGERPFFGPSLMRQAATQFLATATKGSWSDAPPHQAQLTLTRFNCLGCHQRNATGGLNPALVARLEGNQSEQSAEAIVPPPLTDITHKLRPRALTAVLFEGARARPWMPLRMPQFDAALLKDLPAQLAAAEAAPLAAGDESAVPVDMSLAEAGRMLVGSAGFGCTKCHDVRGHKSTGTRGPDLAGVVGRIDRAWYERWMTDPQRIQFGTRMPTVFFQGQSPYKQVLDGDPARQREAIWQYLSACRDLPLPEGTLPPTTALAADAPPELMRTFLPELSARSFTLRGAGDVHVAFDIEPCRLAYAWTGEFLDPQPAWSGRGGRAANLLGPIVWRAPAGFPWAVTGNFDERPDFASQAADTALGATPPEDFQVHPRRVHFLGYRRTGNRYEWRYELQPKSGSPVRFTEHVVGWQEASADASYAGLVRRDRIEATPGAVVWLHVATSTQPPIELQTPDATSVWKVPAVEGPPQFYAARMPAGARWLDVPAGDGQRRSLVLAIPTSAPAVELECLAVVPLTADHGNDETAAAILTKRLLAPTSASTP